MNKFTFLKAFNSPFVRPEIKFYLGKVKYGVPYFFPRVWKKKPDKNGNYAVPKKIGFDFVGLGWKTKWSDRDFRHEYNPIWSFVFFKWQFCVLFDVPHASNYWEAWLYYELITDKTKSQKERIEQCRKEFPQLYSRFVEGDKIYVDYYDLILK